MYIIASFEQSYFVELTITALEQMGIPKKKIFATPLDNRTGERNLFDTIRQSDGFSMIDVAAILGTCGMLLGAIYGMIFRWGPILWGLIGLALGCIVGFGIKFAFIKHTLKMHQRKAPEVVLIINCSEHEANAIHKLLWNHTASGVSEWRRSNIVE